MTHISYKEKDGLHQLLVVGHSGYAESGADIVCSAISIMTHSFAEMLLDLQEENAIRIHLMEIKDGMVSVIYRDEFGCTLGLVKMLKIGFEGLAEQYDKYVSVEWGENDF